MDQLMEGSAATTQADSPAEATVEKEAKRQAEIRARSRAKHLEHALDFVVIGTIGLVAATAGVVRLIEAVSS
jgi:hypothetical protein